jgi:hypothetical protein
MKSIKILLFAFILVSISGLNAQVRVNVNLGTPPVWAPSDRVQSQYYYLPEVDAYYDVPASRFIYLNNGNWIRSERLPKRYSGYNLKGGKVIYLTDYRGNSPYVYHKKHKVKYYYPKYKGSNKAVFAKSKGNKGNYNKNFKGKAKDKGKK